MTCSLISLLWDNFHFNDSNLDSKSLFSVRVASRSDMYEVDFMHSEFCFDTASEVIFKSFSKEISEISKIFNWVSMDDK